MNKIDIAEKQGRHSHCGPSDGKLAIKVGDETLKFRLISLADPIPTGRQIIQNAGFDQTDEFLLFEVSHDHDLTEMKHDDKVDIRGSGEKQFLIFRSSRSERGLINEKRFEWGSQKISGRVLKWLAKADPEHHGVWLKFKDGAERLIEDDQTVSLTPDGAEHFYTAPLIQLCIEDKVYPWTKDTIKTEEIAKLGGFDVSQGVIEVDEEQNERNLKLGEAIKLQPGLSFGKRHHFKRG